MQRQELFVAGDGHAPDRGRAGQEVVDGVRLSEHELEELPAGVRALRIRRNADVPSRQVGDVHGTHRHRRGSQQADEGRVRRVECNAPVAGVLDHRPDVLREELVRRVVAGGRDAAFGAVGEEVPEEGGGGDGLRRVDHRIQIGVVQVSAKAPHQRHPPPARIGPPAHDVPVAAAGLLDRLCIREVLVPGRCGLETQLLVDVGPIPLDHRLGRERQPERLPVVLAIVALALLEVGDVVLVRARKVVVERLHRSRRAVGREERVVELRDVVLALSEPNREQQLLMRFAVRRLGDVHRDPGRFLERGNEGLNCRRGRARDEIDVDLLGVPGRGQTRGERRRAKKSGVSDHEGRPPRC